jgi:hypothetical protein
MTWNGRRLNRSRSDAKKWSGVETLNAEKAYFPLTSEIRRLDSSSPLTFSNDITEMYLFYGRRLIHLLLSSVDTFTHQDRHVLGRLASVPPLGLFIAQVRAMSN